MSWSLKTPVSVFFYRRPDHLRQVMAKVREARPPVLFGVSDGAKAGNPEIQRGVEESRRVFREAIDWPCRWQLLERETNVGSYLSVSRGLDSVFERVEETIVLEDDTVPDASFFRFMAELLEKYRKNPRVGAVCGNNYDDPKDWSGEDSYRFTRYHHSWGWGTWKRAWACFDRQETLLAELPKIKKENWMGLSRTEWAYWERCFRHTYAKKLDAWDYRWTLSLWRHHMVCVIPRINLVRNIGFDAKATHTVEKKFADLKMHQIGVMKFPLVPCAEVKPHRMLDDMVFIHHYRQLEGRRNMLTKFRDKLVAIFGKKESKSSISDTNQYREICLRAAKTKEAFLNFKQNIHYKEILEHTNLETGFKYLKKIKSNSEIYRVIKNFSVNDKFGQPDLHSFPEIGPFSPSTLRYVKVLTDLVERFDSLSGLKIVEIGGGYGGQSLIIHKYARPSSYQILDLPEVLLLTEKYLNCHGIKSVKLHTLDEYLNHRRDFDRDPDLLISNYAFSEISAEIQEIYLRDIILKSKRGYMTMNSISAGCGVSSIPQKDIQKLLQAKGPIHIENEDPLTFPGNQVIWWDWAKV